MKGWRVHSSVLPYRWVFRHFLWVLLLACALGAAIVPAAAASKAKTYEATSLVVTQRFSQSVVALPKFGQTIFLSGAVRDRVAYELKLRPQDLIPAKLSAVTPQDSLIFSVVGRDQDPRRAAQLANVGAAAFVAELNKGGTSVGVFSVQSTATPPSQPVSPPLDKTLAVVIGLIAGAVFGFGLLLMLVLVRRPIVAPEHVVDQLALPGLGIITLPPRGEGGQALPEKAPGVTRLARMVLASGVRTVLVVGDQRDAKAREQTAHVLAIVLAINGPTVYLGDPAAEAAVNGLVRERRGEAAKASSGSEEAIVVASVSTAVDLLSIRGGKWGVVLVGPTGASRARFDHVLDDFQRDDVIGVVLYRRRRRRHPLRATMRTIGRRAGRWRRKLRIPPEARTGEADGAV